MITDRMVVKKTSIVRINAIGFISNGDEVFFCVEYYCRAFLIVIF